MLYQLSHLPSPKLAPSVSLTPTKVDSHLFRTQSQTLTFLKKSEVSRLNLEYKYYKFLLECNFNVLYNNLSCTFYQRGL